MRAGTGYGAVKDEQAGDEDSESRDHGTAPASLHEAIFASGCQRAGVRRRVGQGGAGFNRTDAATAIDGGGTLTDAPARRDVLRLRYGVVTRAAEAAAGKNSGYRQLRSELKMLPALSVTELRAQADDLARQIREVDLLIQCTNWTAELLN